MPSLGWRKKSPLRWDKGQCFPRLSCSVDRELLTPPFSLWQSQAWHHCCLKSRSHYIFYPFLCQLLPFSQVTVHVSHLNPHKVLNVSYLESFPSSAKFLISLFFFPPKHFLHFLLLWRQFPLSSLQVLTIILFISFLYAVIKGKWWVSCTEIWDCISHYGHFCWLGVKKGA